MPAWSNTDATGTKPKFAVERTTREIAILTTTAATNTGNSVLFFGTTQNVSNAAIANGMSIFAVGFGGNGVAGIFAANTTVVNVTANTVTVNVGATATLGTNLNVEFDKGETYKANSQANTYNADTVLVTATRFANSNVTTSHTHSGWVHVQRKVNGDGTVRYIEETLVALANPVASFVASGNTSTTQIYKGL